VKNSSNTCARRIISTAREGSSRLTRPRTSSQYARLAAGVPRFPYRAFVTARNDDVITHVLRACYTQAMDKTITIRIDSQKDKALARRAKEHGKTSRTSYENLSTRP
jgi:hypothetical protein